MPRMIGTILPTAASLRADDEYAARDRKDRKKAGQTLLGQYECRTIGGEMRYYDGADAYAVIGRDMLPRWFVRRGGEWFADRSRSK